MQDLKVGDRVKCVYNDNGSNQYVGEYGSIIDLRPGDYYKYRVVIDNCDDINYFAPIELEKASILYGYGTVSNDEFFYSDDGVPTVKPGGTRYINQIEVDLNKLKN